MRRPTSVVLAGCALSLIIVSASAARSPHDYRKAIIGCWLGPRKFEVYHSDGTWGVKRNEDAPEDIRGRRWRVECDTLILTYPVNQGFGTATYKIISCSNRELILQADGYRQKYTRYSADCQKKA